MASKMTLQQARKILPKFAKSLAPDSKTVAELRGAVMDELQSYRRGENPLEPMQVERFGEWLADTK
jgi:hypothetical protein